jgi:hypothetical protein
MRFASGQSSLVVVGELNQAADQQFFNSVHSPFTAGFTDVFVWHPAQRREASSPQAEQ